MTPYLIFSVGLEGEDGHIYGQPVYARDRQEARASAREVVRERFGLGAFHVLRVYHAEASSCGTIALDD